MSDEASLGSDGQGRWILAGEWGFSAVGKLERCATRLLVKEPPESIDLQGITQMDSAGLALLITWVCAAQAADRKAPRFTNIPEQLRSIADLYAVDRLLA